MKQDNYYCLIRVTPSLDIAIYLFSNKSINEYPLCLVSKTSSVIYQLIDLHDCFINLSLSHLLYLAKELYKVELCLQLKQKYIQD